jgi:hypothetical protein
MMVVVRKKNICTSKKPDLYHSYVRKTKKPVGFLIILPHSTSFLRRRHRRRAPVSSIALRHCAGREGRT